MYNTTLCYLENPRGEYLMLHRVKKKEDINEGKWIGVGGGFEHGESPEECADPLVVVDVVFLLYPVEQQILPFFVFQVDQGTVDMQCLHPQIR